MRILSVILAFWFLSFTTQEVELSELQKLKAQNHKLQIQVAQCQVTLLDRESKLYSGALSKAQLELEAEFRATLKAGPDDKFNWETLKFEVKDVKKDSIK